MLKQSKPVWFLSLFTPRFEKVSITLVTHAVKTRRPSFILKGAMFRCTLRLNGIGEEGAGVYVTFLQFYLETGYHEEINKKGCKKKIYIYIGKRENMS